MKKGSNFYSLDEFKKIVQEYEKDILKFKGEGLNGKYRAWFKNVRSNKGSVSFDPMRIPSSPWLEYKDKGWTHWKELIRSSKFYSFGEFKKIVQENKNDILKFEGTGINVKYHAWLKSVRSNKGSVSFDPMKLPSDPRSQYKDKGWTHWKELIRSSKFYSFGEFKKIVQEYKNDILKFEGESIEIKYKAWFKSIKNNKNSVSFDPKKLPSSPYLQYKGFSWIHLNIKLSKSKPSTQRTPPHKAAQKKATRR